PHLYTLSLHDALPIYAFIDEHTDLEIYRKYIDETAVILLFSKDEYQLVFGKDSVEISELKGNHSILENGSFTLDYYDFITKLTDFSNNKVPRFEAFINLKNQLSKSYENTLKINEMEPKVLTSFVRNKIGRAHDCTPHT